MMKTLGILILTALTLTGCATGGQPFDWGGALQGFNEGMQRNADRRARENEREIQEVLLHRLRQGPGPLPKPYVVCDRYGGITTCQ
jgi:hypothetical protein